MAQPDFVAMDHSLVGLADQVVLLPNIPAINQPPDLPNFQQVLQQIQQQIQQLFQQNAATHQALQENQQALHEINDNLIQINGRLQTM